MLEKNNVPLLSSTEAASLLKISEKTLREWRYLGKHLPWVKIGGSVRYRLSDLNEFIERSTRNVA